MKRTVSLVSLTLLVATAARAQQAPTPAAGPLAAALGSALQRATRNMPAAAELMPADKYGFKPTPEQMSFAEIIGHEAEANEMLCAALGGTATTMMEAPAAGAASKETLVARLRRSFEMCAPAVAALTEGALADSVPYFGGRKATKARVAIALAQDWADHYAQAAIYLRLSGILPPTARPRQ